VVTIKDLSQQAIDEIVNRGLIKQWAAIAAGDGVVMKFNFAKQKDVAGPASVKDRLAASTLLKALACEDSANQALKDIARTFLIRADNPIEMKVAK